MTLNADPRDYDFEPWDDSYDDDRLSLIDRLSGNTAMIAGVLTVIVTFSIVAANALYYQPHEHQGAMFNTRDQTEPRMVENTTAPSDKTFEQEVAALPEITPQPASRPIAEPAPIKRAEKPVAIDPQRVRVRLVQTVLKDLSIYQGDVDGLSGPQTRGAIKKYQRIVGLEETGKIDSRLMAQLTGDSKERTQIVRNNVTESQADQNITVASIRPTPRPAKKDNVSDIIQSGTDKSTGFDRSMIKQLQAGLKQFDNPDIVVDGVQGSQTTAALKLFQETFHLKVTGQPDKAVFQKMRDLGYIN